MFGIGENKNNKIGDSARRLAEMRFACVSSQARWDSGKLTN
jgi:hypothetical protein